PVVTTTAYATGRGAHGSARTSPHLRSLPRLGRTAIRATTAVSTRALPRTGHSRTSRTRSPLVVTATTCTVRKSRIVTSQPFPFRRHSTLYSGGFYRPPRFAGESGHLPLSHDSRTARFDPQGQQCRSVSADRRHGPD